MPETIDLDRYTIATRAREYAETLVSGIEALEPRAANELLESVWGALEESGLSNDTADAKEALQAAFDHSRPTQGLEALMEDPKAAVAFMRACAQRWRRSGQDPDNPHYRRNDAWYSELWRRGPWPVPGLHDPGRAVAPYDLFSAGRWLSGVAPVDPQVLATAGRLAGVKKVVVRGGRVHLTPRLTRRRVIRHVAAGSKG